MKAARKAEKKKAKRHRKNLQDSLVVPHTRGDSVDLSLSDRSPGLSSTPRSPFKTITAKDLQRKVFPPTEFIVPGLISVGLSMLCGAPKVGKSWLSLDLVLSVAVGGRFLGSIPVDRHGVLALCLEDSETRLQQRLEALNLETEWPEDLVFVTERPTGDVVDQISDHLSASPDTKLVVIDTFAKVRPPSRVRQGAYLEDYAFAGGLQKLAIEKDVAIVAVHHDRKQVARDFVDAVSGTHGLTGAADNVLLLTRERAQTDGLLMMTGRDLPDEDPWQLRRSGPRWLFSGTISGSTVKATMGLGSRASALVEYVNQADHQVKPHQVANELGLTNKKASDELRRLADAGRIRKVERGLYAPVNPPAPVTEDTGTCELAELAELAPRDSRRFANSQDSRIDHLAVAGAGDR